MSVPNSKKNQNQARDLKQRVLTCLHKLSDRDTHSAAASELESIAKTLSPETISPFLSSISATDSSDRSPVRKQCLRLISLLSECHGNALTPHLSKLLSAVVRRLRDQDSAVRSACISASSAISSHLTRPPFSSIVKPFLEALFTEQDANSQIGAALCLAAVIEASPDPDVVSLRKLMPRFEKLLKCESFRAKAALLTLIGNVIAVGGAASQQTVRNLVPCLMDFVSSEDWATRKAAAEALVSLAMVEREVLSEFKASCLKTFEAKKFDKVKLVRETMNQMVEAWKEIPDPSDEVSPPPDSSSSSKENASDGRYPPGSKTSYTITSSAPQITKRHTPPNKSPYPDGSCATTARKRIMQGDNEKITGAAMFRKLDRKKPSNCKVEIAALHGPSGSVVSADGPRGRDERSLDKVETDEGYTRLGTRRALFNNDEKLQEFGAIKTGSRVVPCQDDKSESTIVVSNDTGDLCRNQKDCEDLALIRKQLIQIETQQSNLFDLLQKFIGSSQNGMRSLETRVHGLELALDEISFDLAVSTGRMSNTGAAVCCKLPGAEFLSSKLWRKTETRSSSSRFSASGVNSTSAARNKNDKSGDGEGFKPESRRYHLQGGRGFIVNPLAEIPEGSSSHVSKNHNNGASHRLSTT